MHSTKIVHFHLLLKVPDEDFEVLLEYMADLKGRARQLTVEKAEKLLSAEETDDKEGEAKLQTGGSMSEVLILTRYSEKSHLQSRFLSSSSFLKCIGAI